MTIKGPLPSSKIRKQIMENSIWRHYTTGVGLKLFTRVAVRGGGGGGRA